MRVLNVTDRLSARGGADWHLLGILGEQAAIDDVCLAVGHDDGTAAAPCRVEHVPELADGSETAVRSALERVASALNPDVIHVHNCMSADALAWAAERGAIMTVQDHRVFCPGRGKVTLEGEVCREPMAHPVCRACFTDGAYFERIYAATAARLAAVTRMSALITLSHYMERELVAAGVDAERIETIPPFVHGLDPEAAPNGPPCVLFVGRLVIAKGVLDAAEAHRRSGSDLPLVFAGTGSERARLEAAGHEVLGWLPHHQLSSVYKRARAVVMPSRWQEPFGIVGLEALSMGAPVAAWASGGVGEWHADPTPWGDLDALAVALREAIGKRATAPSGFDRRSLMGRLRRLYERVSRNSPRVFT